LVFQQYINYLPSEHILFYEATIRTKGRALEVINPAAEDLEEDLSSKNNNNLYDNQIKDVLLAKLLRQSSGAFWRFYSADQLNSV